MLLSAAHNYPHVSVIIPAKGRMHLVKECLSSVCAQTLADWEALLIDDGSDSDELADLRLSFQHEPRIRILSRKDLPAGANHCRNIGIEQSRAPFIVFLDSDDYLAPDCLRHRFEAITKNSQAGFLVFAHAPFVRTPGDCNDSHPAWVKRPRLNWYSDLSVPWQTGGPIWRKQVLLDLGGWDQRLQRYQDFEFHARALIQNVPYAISNSNPDFYYRLPAHRNSISGDTAPAASLEAQEIALNAVAQNLCSAGSLTRKRRSELIRRYLFISGGWTTLGRFDRARTVWRSAYHKGFISFSTFIVGSVRLLIRRSTVLMNIFRWMRRQVEFIATRTAASLNNQKI